MNPVQTRAVQYPEGEEQGGRSPCLVACTDERLLVWISVLSRWRDGDLQPCIRNVCTKDERKAQTAQSHRYCQCLPLVSLSLSDLLLCHSNAPKAYGCRCWGCALWSGLSGRHGMRYAWPSVEECGDDCDTAVRAWRPVRHGMAIHDPRRVRSNGSAHVNPSESPRIHMCVHVFSLSV